MSHCRVFPQEKLVPFTDDFPGREIPAAPPAQKNESFRPRILDKKFTTGGGNDAYRHLGYLLLYDSAYVCRIYEDPRTSRQRNFYTHTHTPTVEDTSYGLVIEMYPSASVSVVLRPTSRSAENRDRRRSARAKSTTPAILSVSPIASVPLIIRIQMSDVDHGLPI